MTSPALLLRLCVLLAGMVLLWRTVLSLLPYEAGRNAPVHVAAGVMVTAGVLALVRLLLRRDALSWRMAGCGAARENLRAIALGAILWLVPAAAGAAVCIAMGWTSLELRASAGPFAWTLTAMLLGVFLVEALPEEIALRGYAQGLAARTLPAWAALLLQVALFTGFAWAIGALVSFQQWLFIPSLALILGYVRALTGNVWTGIGVHTAWMTVQQWLALHVEVEGLLALQFVAFALLPSATLGIALGLRHPHFDWRRRFPAS